MQNVFLKSLFYRSKVHLAENTVGYWRFILLKILLLVAALGMIVFWLTADASYFWSVGAVLGPCCILLLGLFFFVRSERYYLLGAYCSIVITFVAILASTFLAPYSDTSPPFVHFPTVFFAAVGLLNLRGVFFVTLAIIGVYVGYGWGFFESMGLPVKPTLYPRPTDLFAERILTQIFMFAIAIVIDKITNSLILATAKEKMLKEEIKESQFSQLLLNTLCHDINNGLAVAKYGSDKLNSIISDDNFDFKKEITFTGRKIASGITTIENIRNYIMDLQKAKTISGSINKTGIALHESMELMGKHFESQLSAKKLELITQGKFDTRIKSDRAILENHVFPNLIANAIKFSAEGSEIRIEEKLTDRYYILSFLNKAEPVSDEVINSFQKGNVTTSSYGTKGERGHGFGLLITKIMLAAIGAELKISNLPGRLVCVAIVFPYNEQLKAA